MVLGFAVIGALLLMLLMRDPPAIEQTAARSNDMHEPALFEIAERCSPSRITGAVTHVSHASRAGVVLLYFSRRQEAAS
jgi:hypothetical protein